MPLSQKEKPDTLKKTSPSRRDSTKTRYSAPYSQSPKCSSSPDPARRATSLTRDSLSGIKPSPPAHSQALAPSNLLPALRASPAVNSPSPALKPLPTFKFSSSKPLPLPAAKSPLPTTRPEWIAPPGKYSPTQIPTPKFGISKRKSWSTSLHANATSRDGSGRGLWPTTPGRVERERRASTPKIPKTANPSSLLFQELDVGEAGTNTLNPNPIVTGTRSKNVSPIILPTSKDASEENKSTELGLGLGLSLEILEFGVCVSVSSTTSAVSSACSSLSNNAEELNAKKETKSSAQDKEKRDSLSPTHDPAATPITIPPLLSSSHTHPYTSGIHISSPCTSGSLTHRLLCGHLILTPHKPEICAKNCVVQKTTFESARLKAQGFGANVRGLDEKWWCEICDKEERREAQGQKGGGRKCMSVLGKGDAWECK